jgi:Carboxypeptidase regulatory-like domain
LLEKQEDIKMKKLIILGTFVLTIGCAGEIPPGVCAPVEEPLRAGQTIDAGRIHVTNDAEKIYVAFETTGGWVLNKTHINFSDNLSGVPRSGGGAPVNGKFTFQTEHAPPVTQFGYEYPIAKLAGSKVTIVTHAEVERKGQKETAYGGQKTFPDTNRWAYFTEYTVCKTTLANLEGVTFLDINKDAQRHGDEPALPAISVVLQDAQGHKFTTISSESGRYSFTAVPAGTYSLTAASATGYQGSSKTVTLAGNTVADLPLTFHFADFCALTADGFTIGYWGNNISKALEGTRTGVQVDAARLQSLVESAALLSLDPLHDLTMESALRRLTVTGPLPTDLLTKQLVASELNQVNGAATQPVASVGALLIHQAEFMLKYAEQFTPADLLNTKDWLDAYNNTHGGKFVHSSCP